MADDESSTPRFVFCRECWQAYHFGTPCPCGSSTPPMPLDDEGTAGLSLGEVNRFFAGSGSIANRHLEQRDEWVREYREKTIALLSRAEMHRDSLNIYWVRLHGMMTELREELRPTVELLAKMPAEEEAVWKEQQPVAWRSIELTEDVVDALDAHVDTLTQDQLAYADYRRQRVCHLHQGVMAPQIKGKRGGDRTLKEGYELKVTGEVLDWQARRQAINRVLERHDENDLRVAHEIADALGDCAGTLWAAWVALRTVGSTPG